MKQIQRLPIPPLDQSIDQYLERIRPLVSPDIYKESYQKCEKFKSGGGKQLHSLLENWDKKDGVENWLVSFWDEAYLAYRSGINGNVNYIMTLDDAQIPRFESFAGYCANLVAGLSDIYCQIADGTLDKDVPVCTYQYPFVFKSCRIPREKEDEIFVGESSRRNNYVLILRGGNMYCLPVTGKSGEVFSPAQLAPGISEILNLKDAAGLNVGALTTAPRADASKLRDAIIKLDSRNQDNFRKIDSALFALCIDEPEDSRSNSQTTFDILYGQGKNRYFDKCFQLIVGTDYSAGFNFEHAGYDGSVGFSMMAHLYRRLKEAQATESKPATAPEAEKLEWVSDENIRNAIGRMESDGKQRGSQLHVRMKRFENFGKNGIKELKASPDAFFNLALQLAWHRLSGRVNNTYEAVSMQHYYQGRTECARPSTSQAKEFVEAASQGASSEKLASLARSAFDRHTAMLGECRQAAAPERYLFGLQMMQSMNSIKLAQDEDIFSCEAYQTLKRDIISASGLGAEFVGVFAYAPVAADGFGVGYGVCADDIRLGVSCFESNKGRIDSFVAEIENALLDLREILK